MEETSQQLPTAQRKSPMTNRKTLVVGAGITGGALARLLHDAKRSLQYAGEVLVWEKSNIAGGRMMARSFRKNRNVHVDMGAQYLTKFTSANDDVREMLLQHEKLSVFEDREILQDPTRALPRDVQHHTVAHHALGFRSVVEYLLTDAALQVSREVERFEVLDANHIKVTSTDGHEEVVQDLVLTCPIPNVLSILDKSAFQPAPQQLQALQRVEYSQRIAVALLFDESIAANVRALGWTSKYVTKDEDPIVRFLCWDNLKKHQAGDSFALLVHTGVPFGAQHMDNKDQNDEILATIVQCVHKLLAFLPEPKDTILHRWRMSQVTKPYSESADATAAPVPSITLSSSPRIVLAGDAFLGSVFDNCLLSAKHAASTLLETSGSPPTSGL